MSTTSGGSTPGPANNPLLDLMRPQPTGGLIVTFREKTERSEQLAALSSVLGAGVRSFSAMEEQGAQFDAATHALLLEDYGVGYVSEDRVGTEMAALAGALRDAGEVEEVRPEFYLFALETWTDTAERTWGIAAIGANKSTLDGSGIRLAVLDTGIDANHPDFAGRSIVSQSFVTGETVDDVQGHGTHCAGTACGGPVSSSGLRYGVAPGAELHVGKVLSNGGSGRERDIQTGMAWAIASGCEVVSMSLGRSVRPGESPSPDYERIGRLALDRGTLIVAAAGNDSSRQYGHIAPVNAPANSPSIMAVAAVDHSLRVAPFSCGGINPDSDVDLAAPGVAVFSCVPRPRLYTALSGTSMACPHVAGAAALWAQSDPKLRGHSLRKRLVTTVRALPDPARDVGAGLVRCP